MTAIESTDKAEKFFAVAWTEDGELSIGDGRKTEDGAAKQGDALLEKIGQEDGTFKVVQAKGKKEAREFAEVLHEAEQDEEIAEDVEVEQAEDVEVEQDDDEQGEEKPRKKREYVDLPVDEVEVRESESGEYVVGSGGILHVTRECGYVKRARQDRLQVLTDEGRTAGRRAMAIAQAHADGEEPEAIEVMETDKGRKVRGQCVACVGSNRRYGKAAEKE